MGHESHGILRPGTQIPETVGTWDWFRLASLGQGLISLGVPGTRGRQKNPNPNPNPSLRKNESQSQSHV